ncbi:MAG: hypothetical protein HKM94_08150 [Halobacteria archaeon]|nr:hypothetical protein [Halobacteria archaeon]
MSDTTGITNDELGRLGETMNDIEKMDQEELNLYQRLNKVREDVVYVQKGKEISFTTKRGTMSYKAVTHDAVTDAIRDALIEHGVMTIPTVLEHEMVAPEGDGNMYRTVVKMEIKFVNIDNPREEFTAVGIGYGDDKTKFGPGDKGPGKAVSYTTKNIYLKVILLVTGDEDEERAVGSYKSLKKAASAEDLELLREGLKEIEKEEESFTQFIAKQKDIVIEDFESIPATLVPYALLQIDRAKATKERLAKEQAK